MTYCTKCGNAVPDEFAFCPNCGEKRFTAPIAAAPMNAAPVQPRVSGRARGFAIASLAVGIEGMVVSILFGFYSLLALLFASLDEIDFFGKFMGMYMIIFLGTSLASGIVASILSRKALAEHPTLRLAQLGKNFGLVATIISGVSILISLLAVII